MQCSSRATLSIEAELTLMRKGARGEWTLVGMMGTRVLVLLTPILSVPRFVLFLQFAESRKGSSDDRMLNAATVYSLRFAFWGLDISTFKWLNVPHGLWRVTHAVVVGWANLKRIGIALKWYATDSHVTLTFVDSVCLLWKGKKIGR